MWASCIGPTRSTADWSASSMKRQSGRSIPVVFGQAVVSTCREDSLQAAEQFMNFMMSPRIQKLLLKYGFDAVPPRPHVGNGRTSRLSCFST